MEKQDLSPGNPVYYFPDRKENRYNSIKVSIVKHSGDCPCCENKVYTVEDENGETYSATRDQLHTSADSSEPFQLTTAYA